MCFSIYAQCLQILVHLWAFSCGVVRFHVKNEMMRGRNNEARGSCVRAFVGLGKGHGRVLAEELWYCMSRSRVKTVLAVVQDLYESW